MARFRINYEPDWMVDEDIEADHHEENEKTLDFYIGREKVRSVDKSHIASVEKRP